MEEKAAEIGKIPIGLPPGMRILEHQIGGHTFGNGKSKTGMLKDENGYLLKPLQRPPLGLRELHFYEKVTSEKKDPIVLELQKFLPQFHGAVSLQVDNEDVTFLVMEDVTENFSRLCVVDTKMGERTWDPEATEEKRLKEEAKYRGTRKTVGFCVQGMKIYEDASGKTMTLGREYGKKLDQHTMKDAFRLFLNGTTGLQLTLVDDFLHLLYPILSWFRRQTHFTFYGSSLLLSYDAARVFPPNGTLRPSEDGSNRSPVAVHMIDFAHVFPGEGDVDQNYLFGLVNLIKIFEELSEEAS